MNFRPLNDHVALRPEKEEFADEGELIAVPEAWREDNANRSAIIRESKSVWYAEVVAVGPGNRDSETGERLRIDLEPGQRVAYKRQEATDLQIEELPGLVIVHAQSVMFERQP